MRRPRFLTDVRWLIVAVVAVGYALGLAIHVQTLVRFKNYVSPGVLLVEGLAASVLLVSVLAVGAVVHLSRRLDRRADTPRRTAGHPSGPR